MVAAVAGGVVLLACLILFGDFARYTLREGRMIQVLGNVKQLQLAMEQMTLDNQKTGGAVRWTCSGTTPLSFDEWHKLLVAGYLSEKDFQKLISFRGEEGMEGAMNVFAVCESDPPDTVLFASKNWHGIGTTNLSGGPFGNHEFFVFRKDGDGAILQPQQASDTNLVGSGGLHHFLPLK